MLNRPTRIAVNFLDYIDFKNRTASEWAALTPGARSFVQDLEGACGAPVSYLGVGPRLSDNILRMPVEAPPSFAERKRSPVNSNIWADR